jgi:hypothetical protein
MSHEILNNVVGFYKYSLHFSVKWYLPNAGTLVTKRGVFGFHLVRMPFEN